MDYHSFSCHVRIILPRARVACTRGRVIGVSVSMFVCLCVCGDNNEHFEQSRPAYYELYLLCTNHKCSFYTPHEQEHTSGSQAFWLSKN